jgi:hypothetical protein
MAKGSSHVAERLAGLSLRRFISGNIFSAAVERVELARLVVSAVAV